MLTLNFLLEGAGLDLKRSRLVRHKDIRALPGRSPYELWRAGGGGFELYQRIQGRQCFAHAEKLVSFVVTPTGETLFVGIYQILSVSKAPTGLTDPVLGRDVGGNVLYEIQQTGDLRDLVGRLVIDWGLGFRAWIQRPDRKDKTVLEIKQART
jgi:hypothetical protein